VIRLQDDVGYVRKAQSIDYVLRALRSLIGHGTVTVDGSRVLTATHIAAQTHAMSCLKTLSQIGAAIVNPRSD